MLRIRCNNYDCWCVIIAIWTIIQTAAHCYGIIYVMWWRDCSIDKDSENYYLLYLTYFFTRKCENETRTSLEMNRNVILTILDGSESSNSTLESLNSKVDVLIMTYLILDALWIVSSVALITGACLKIRELWALPFYVPWIVMDAIILLFDGFCSIFFGLNIPADGSIFDWLHFIGFNVRLNEVKKLEGDMPWLVAGAASVIMMCISARGVVVWVINLACMVVVVKATKKALRKTPERSHGGTRRGRNRSCTPSERIRKWNQFYGSVDGKRREEELEDDLEEARRREEDCVTDSNYEDGRVGVEVKRKGGGVRITPPGGVLIRELRGQVPWSYVDAVRPGILSQERPFADEATSRF